MCEKSSFERETSAAFGKTGICPGWRLLPALIIASAAYALTAPPASNKTVDAAAYEQSGAINPLTLRAKARDGLTLMIDPVAAEPKRIICNSSSRLRPLNMWRRVGQAHRRYRLDLQSVQSGRPLGRQDDGVRRAV